MRLKVRLLRTATNRNILIAMKILTEDVDQLLLVNMPKEFSPDSKVGKMLNRLLVDEGHMDQESCVEVCKFDP